MNSLFIISPFIAFLITYLFIPVLRKAAVKIHLVDKPNQRKLHSDVIPLMGGVSIYLGVVLTLGLCLPFNSDVLAFKNVFIAASIMLAVGVIDDRIDVRASLKLAIQLLLAHFIFLQGIRIESFQGLFGIYELSFWGQYVLTVIVIAGVVNAFNLMDGIDGLAAGLAMLGLGVLTILSIVLGNNVLAMVFVAFIGSLAAFLRFNLHPNRKIFMGDGGSLMIGFIIVVSGIHMVQAASQTTYSNFVTLAVIAILVVPVLDALRVFRKRAKSGKSMFSPDKSHLHHLILSTGLKHKASTLAILGIIIAIMVVSFINYQMAGITFSFAVMVVMFWVISYILHVNDQLNHWKSKVRQMENAQHFGVKS